MISIKNLNKSYGDKVVFTDFNLDIEKGKILCILGESGSGKTTLLNVLSNLTDYQGKVDRQKCSVVFPKPNLFPNMTVKENLLIVNNDQQLVEKTLADFYLTDKANSYSSQLSAGQAQRVSLARAICYDANLLLMDEPFINLDIGLKQNLVEKIKADHTNRGNTVVVVTHDILECVSLADRIIVLSNGKIVEDIKDVNEKTEKYLFGLMVNLFEKQNS